MATVGSSSLWWEFNEPITPATLRAATVFAWAGRFAFVLLIFAIAPRPLGSQQGAATQDRSPTSVAAREPDGRVDVVGDDTTKHLASLENLIELGQYQQAIPSLELYLRDHDNSAKAHYDLGYVYFRTHQVGSAVRELSKSLQLNGKDPQAHKILGLVCTFVGRYDLAETELQAAAELQPDSAEIHYFLGRVYYTRQVFPMALKQFETAIQLNPLYMKAYGNLGLVMEVLGKDDAAVEDYTTAARINDAQHLNSPWPFEYLSAHYNRDRQPDLAIQFAQKALLVDTKCDLAYYDLAKAFEAQRDWQKALDAVQKAIAINASTPEYFYLLSNALRRLGKIQESDAALKRFQQIHDDQNAMAEEWRDASHPPNPTQPPLPPDDEQ